VPLQRSQGKAAACKSPISASPCPANGLRFPKAAAQAIAEAVRSPSMPTSAYKRRSNPLRCRVDQPVGAAGVGPGRSDGLGASAAAWSWPGQLVAAPPNVSRPKALADPRPRSPHLWPGAEGAGARTVKLLAWALIWACPRAPRCRRSVIISPTGPLTGQPPAGVIGKGVTSIRRLQPHRRWLPDSR